MRVVASMTALAVAAAILVPPRSLSPELPDAAAAHQATDRDPDQAHITLYRDIDAPKPVNSDGEAL